MFSFRFSENPKMRTAQWTVLGVTLIVAMGLVFGLLVQFLWNATLTEIFDFPAISFWQAIGLFVLAKFLFGFGAGGKRSDPKHKKPSADQRRSTQSKDVSELADDETFKKYWQEEGRQSYEAFRKGGPNSESKKLT